MNIFIFGMDGCKNIVSSTWNSVQLLFFLIKLFAFTILILVSLLASLSENLEIDKSVKIWWKPIYESFVGDFIFVIYKAFGRGFQFLKWAKKDYLQHCSKALQVRREKYNWHVMQKFTMNKLFKVIDCQQKILNEQVVQK